MNDEKIFIDTNILIYAYDRTAGKKHVIARDILLGLWDSGLGVVSTQVLQEFFVIVTRKIPNPLTVRKAKEIVADFLKWQVVINDGESILTAIELVEKHHFSFWDSLIIDAALKSDATVLLSEDLSHGRTVNGLRIKNPFASP